MADKTIGELVSATTIGDSDLFVLQQDGVAKNITGETVANYIYAASGATKEEIEELLELFPAIKATYGAPLVASTVADMTDHTHVYVYTGSETGYTSGNWYYWDGSAWVSGGIYNSTAFTTDKTLTIPGAAADAKVAGDKIGKINAVLDKEQVHRAWPLTLYVSGSTYYYFDANSQKFSSSGSKKYLSNRYLNNVEASYISITCDMENIKMALRYFDEDATATISGSTGYLGGTDFSMPGTPVYFPAEAKKFLVTFSTVDGSAISSEEVDAIPSHLFISLSTDSSLSEAGKAADAKAVGNELSLISESAEKAEVTPGLNSTYSGVTIERISETEVKLYGTSTATRRILCLNGQNKEAISSSPFDKTLSAGHYLVEMTQSGTFTGVVAWAYTYTTFADYVNIVTTNNQSAVIDFDSDVMVGLGIASGTNYGTEDAPTIVSISAKRTTATDLEARERLSSAEADITALEAAIPSSSYRLEAVDEASEDESGKTDMTQAILGKLQEYGCCELGVGTFYVSGGIDLPSGSVLRGQGRGTVIRMLAASEQAYCVKIQQYNQICDVRFSGAYSDITPTQQGTRTAILFEANADGSGGTATTTRECMLSNVWIGNFSDSGIKCHNTSINVRQGLYACNVYIVNCWAGINIDYYSEFHKFVNVCISLCRYGCRNNGGNNNFTNCTFHASLVAFYIDGTKANAAHGVVNGCTFCHSGSNAGKAIQIDNASYGYVISNSQFWYNSVNITNSDGIVFSGCEFGRGTTDAGATIRINGGNLVLFVGCVFMADTQYAPDIQVTNNSKVRFDNCYGSTSGNPIGIA